MPFDILRTIDPLVSERFEATLVITGLDSSGNPNAVVGDNYELSIDPIGIMFDNFELTVTSVDSSNRAEITFVSPNGFPVDGTYTIEFYNKGLPTVLATETFQVSIAVPAPPAATIPTIPTVVAPPPVILPPPPVVQPPPRPTVIDQILHFFGIAVVAMLVGAAIMALLAILCLPFGVVAWISKNGSSTSTTTQTTPPVVINTNGVPPSTSTNQTPPQPPTVNSGNGNMQSWPSPCKKNCP